MKTISNNRKKRFPYRAIVLGVAFVLVLGVVLLWRDAAASILWRILNPVLAIRSETLVASGGFFGQFASNAELAKENSLLRAELASSTTLLTDRNFLYQENLELKRRLGHPISSTATLASVLMRPPWIPYDTLTIDVGKDKGIRENALVSAGGSAYIGRIAQVYDTTSRVVLFSSPGQEYQALLRGTIPIAIQGQGSGSLRGELPVGTEVAVGDTVLLPGIMPTFAGHVVAVRRSEGESFQTVYLQLSASPFTLRYVEVQNIAL